MQPVKDVAEEARALDSRKRGGVRLEPALGQGDNYDFYRCCMCHRLITYLEERKTLMEQREKICPCGSSRYSPAQFKWRHLFLPRVAYFALLRILGRA